jgi:hypothetical protein
MFKVLAALPAIVNAFSAMPGGDSCPEPTVFHTLEAAMQMAQMVARAQSPVRAAQNARR